MHLIKSYLFVILLMVLIQLSACSESNLPEPPDVAVVPALAVNTTTLAYGATGGTKEIVISSNVIWRLEFSTNSWSRPSLQSTKGNATVQIAADANPTLEARNMSYRLSAEGTQDIVINITQDAKIPETEPEVPQLPDFINPDNTGMRNMTSLQISKDMGLGWNLGNSLEAIISNNGQLSGNETSWGNAVVSKQFIDNVKAAGFNTIRMPASWSHKFDDETNFKINHQWMLRVEEVVNYALDNDMYVMINIHWDGNWMNAPTYAKKDEINNRLAIMWKQIAKHFRNYDDKLMFAGTNEVHISGNYGEPTAENTEVQNSFNQTFINTVRATGGRNTFRHLIVQAYNTNIDLGIRFMTIPTDTTPDRLMVELHYYDPYQFALDESSNKYLWGKEHQGNAAHSAWGDEDWLDKTFSEAKAHFVDKGYPIILGEYGAILRTNLPAAAFALNDASRNKYLHYTTKKALENGMVPVYWDNGFTGHNGMGLFNRATGATVHAGALNAIITAKD